MRLEQLLETVESSTVGDWHKTETATLYGWNWGEKGGSSYLEPRFHDTLAVLKSDVDITIAFGAETLDSFQEPWVEKFPDSHARKIAIWLRYRGTMVYEWDGVYVDGGRYLVLLPDFAAGGVIQFSRDKLPLARLLFDLAHPGGPHQTVEEVLALAEVPIV